MNRFWNIETDKKKKRCQLDLFGYVGGSRDDPFGKGFNESEFLDEFRQIPSDSELNISVNSFGGAVYTGLSIYSLLKAHQGPITFRIDGAAMSAATIITSVPGARVIMPKGSMMMIHKVSSVAFGNTDDMRKMADDMEKLENNVISIYAEKTGRTPEEIKEKLNAETYFTAEEAVEFGLADEVDESVTVENKAVDGFVMLNGLKADAAIFSHAPEGFIKKADTQKAEKQQASAIKKEVPKMDLEKLKAEYPELVQAIRNEAMAEGAGKERTRIQAIEDAAPSGFEDIVQAAKFDSCMSVESFAVAVCKAVKDRQQAEQAKAKEMLQNRADDARTIEQVKPEGNAGVDDTANKTEEAAIASLKRAFKQNGGN
ncbi:MAG: head maturation protease, ClpP-related [Sutterella sp.]